jgi:magnesium chelatase family protein
VELRVVVIPAGPEESSEAAACRVSRAVELQRERFKGTDIRRNARMTTGMTEKYRVLTGEARRAFHTALETLHLSGRAFHGILRVGRTLADLEGKDTITTAHILEAVQHRLMGEDPYDIFNSGL